MKPQRIKSAPTLVEKIVSTHNIQVAMIGAGAIGGVTAAFIKQAGHDIEIVCKHQALAEKINTTGIHISGKKGAHQIRLKAVKEIAHLSGPKDLVFIATKAADCVTAAQQLLPKLTPKSVVVSLQNGISEPALAKVLGKTRVIGCVVGWGASHNGQGELEVTSEGEFIIGNLDHKPDGRLAPIQEMLNRVYPTRISTNILGELYAKLIINACINSLGVIGGVRLGKLLADKKARTICMRLMREAMAVANAMNIQVEAAGGGKLDFNTFLESRGRLAEMKRHLTIRIIGFKYRRIKSSSLQSIERGHRSEVDFLNGYICDHGQTHHIPTPVNNAVRAMVLEIESGTRDMSMINFNELV